MRGKGERKLPSTLPHPHPRPHHHLSLALLLLLSLTGMGSRAEVTCPEACTCNTEEVQCQNSEDILEVPATLPNNGTLHTLLVARTKIRVVNASTFHNLRQLRRLDLHNNAIETLEDGAFEDLEALDTLVLRRNYLQQLSNHTFAGLGGLRVLELSYNHFVGLNNGWFRHLTGLHVLDLARNQIEHIQELAFVGLGSLQVLNLTRNKLITMTGSYFAPLPSLRSLVVDDNTIRVIESEAFSSLLALTRLSLTGNRNLSSLQPDAFVSQKKRSFSLETLSLKGTRLTQVPVEVLKTLPALRTLDLSQTAITALRSRSFSLQSRLVNLTLDSLPGLSHIEEDAFLGLHSLEKLVISNNKMLTTISWGAFRNLSSLKYLDLHSNRMETFRSGLAHWQDIDVVDLRGNPLRCDCHAAWILALLEDRPNASEAARKFSNPSRKLIHYVCKNTTTTTTSVAQTDARPTEARTAALTRQMACYMPRALNGKCLAELTAEEMRCPTAPEPRSKRDNTDQRFKVAIISATLTSFFLLTCGLFLKFRRRVCSVCRRQYRYKSHRNHGANGGSPGAADIVELETTQLEDLDSDTETSLKA